MPVASNICESATCSCIIKYVEKERKHSFTRRPNTHRLRRGVRANEILVIPISIHRALVRMGVCVHRLLYDRDGAADVPDRSIAA